MSEKVKHLSITFNSEVSALTERNASFDSGVLRVCYTGQNRNNSFISKETIERCVPSMYYCPVVCNYDRDADMIGSHDIEVVADGNGSPHIVNVTQPVGVVPGDAKHWYEEIQDDSGIHEYLCTEVLLWKRQEAYGKIKRDGISAESMEISVRDGGMNKDGVYVIDDFEFTAFCLLGTAEPCFESASLEVFSMNDFRAELDEMMAEYKQAFALTDSVQPSQEVDTYNDISQEGGREVLSEKENLIAEYGFTVDDLDFAIADLELDDLRAKLEEMKAAPEEQEPEQKPENFALESLVRDELIRAVESEKRETEYGGKIARYWFWDYDKEAGMVYVEDSGDWNIYGFSFTMDGDKAVVDFNSKQRMRLELVPFDEGSQGAPDNTPFARVFQWGVQQYQASKDEWAEKYQTASNKITEMENELGELRQFKTDTENAAAKDERDEVLAQFEDLAGDEAFENLTEHCMDYSLEDLEEKCYAIRGRKNTPQMQFSHKQTSTRLVIEHHGEEDRRPYGDLFEKYGYEAK